MRVCILIAELTPDRMNSPVVTGHDGVRLPEC